MDNLIECALKTLISSYPDLFGHDGEFESYEIDKQYAPALAVASNVLFIHVKHRQNDQKTTHALPPPSFLLKTTRSTSPFGAIQAPLFKNEFFFYARVVPLFRRYSNFEASVPKFYNGHLEMNRSVDNGVIVLENLRALGYRPHPSTLTLDYQHAALVMRKLGAFHAHSYIAQQRDPHAYFIEANGLNEVLGHISLDWLDSLRQNLRQTAAIVCNDPRYAARTAEVDRIADHLEAALHRCLQLDREDPTLVIRHGDVVGPNFLFLYENDRPVDCKMVDWSHAALSYSTADLSYFLYMGLDQSTRAGCWDELLDHYCGSLSRTFPSARVPTKATLEKGICERGLYFGVVAMFYKPYLMARNDLGEQIPIDVSPTRILEIGDTYYPEEKAAILKDMIDRDIIGIRKTVQIV